VIEIIVDGEPRYLMPPEYMEFRKTAFRGVYGDSGSGPMVPRANWQPSGLKGIALPIKDQNGIGACNAFATVTAMEYAYQFAYNQAPQLSAGWLYGNINGGRDQGSLLEDAIQWVQKHGVCLASTVGMLDWRSKSQSAIVEAESYKVTEWWECPTFEHVASAVQNGFAVNIGMMWYDGDRPDSDGWLPDRPRGGAGGHAIARTNLVQRNGVWGIEGPNSWGERWGNRGWFTVSENRMKNEEGNFGWFAVRSVTAPPNLQPIPAPTV